MIQLLQDKSSLLMAPVVWASRGFNAIAGPWGRGFPLWNSWPCPPFFGWNQGWLGLLLTVLFWAAVIAICVLVVKRLFFHQKTQSPVFSTPLRPLDILKQRYARGEISREEFMALRQDLQI